MSRIVGLFAFVSLLGLAAPAAAEGSFGQKGSWLLGGGTYLRYQTERGEWEDEARKYYTVSLYPTAGWFFADRLALRLQPGLEWDVDEEPGETRKSVWLSLEAGPTAYFPVAGDDLFVLTGVSFGFERGTHFLPEATRIRLSGPRFVIHAGLAIPVESGGVVEVALRATQRGLLRTQDDLEVDYDISNLTFGVNYAVRL